MGQYTGGNSNNRAIRGVKGILVVFLSLHFKRFSREGVFKINQRGMGYGALFLFIYIETKHSLDMAVLVVCATCFFQ